jgi:GT2 family glycosyltransferase
MSTPLVSVVMVTRNVERFLPQAIESILTQSFKDFEFIILDFGSTDSSRKIAGRYGVRTFELPECGLSRARNAACGQARGKYIAVMDADDIALGNRLRVQVDYLEAHPDVALLGGLAECINSAGKPLGFMVHLDPPTEDSAIKAALQDHSPFCHPTTMFRRDAFERIGGYRPIVEQAEDYDLFARMSEKYGCAGLNQVILHYRIHPGQLSVGKQRRQTMYMAAAKASTKARRNCYFDPLDKLTEITPEALEGMGISRAEQNAALVQAAQLWVKFSCLAGEEDSAREGIVTLLQSDIRGADKRRISDLYHTLSGLYWKKHQVWNSAIAVSLGVLTRPASAARPLKSLLRRG